MLVSMGRVTQTVLRDKLVSATAPGDTKRFVLNGMTLVRQVMRSGAISRKLPMMRPWRSRLQGPLTGKPPKKIRLVREGLVVARPVWALVARVPATALLTLARAGGRFLGTMTSKP